MYKTIPAHTRGPQILSLLHEYGPLSVKGLETIIRPKMTKRRLQEALLRLYEKGLVIRRFEGSKFSRQYYELSQADRSRDIVHEMTGIERNLLLQPYFRSQELLHNEECAFWSVFLKETFGDADVVRDFNFKHQEELVNLLFITQKEDLLLPDILLHFPKQHDRPRVTIAVEIELSRKSDKRLHQKFKKYMSTTRLDGLIYLCHQNSLIETLQGVYAKMNRSDFLRIGHYQDNFLLFGNRKFNPETSEPVLFNAINNPVSLKEWVDQLRILPYEKRRHLKFSCPA